MVIGWEAMIVLRDICGLDDERERTIVMWMARVLVEAMLAESGTNRITGGRGLGSGELGDGLCRGLARRVFGALEPSGRRILVLMSSGCGVRDCLTLAVVRRAHL